MVAPDAISAAARAREEARERETRARDADGGGRADDDETTSARAIEACAEVRAVGRDVEARVERAVRECEETVRMGATETMRARVRRGDGGGAVSIESGDGGARDGSCAGCG